jgi:hypothetical protein
MSLKQGKIYQAYEPVYVRDFNKIGTVQAQEIRWASGFTISIGTLVISMFRYDINKNVDCQVFLSLETGLLLACFLHEAAMHRCFLRY